MGREIVLKTSREDFEAAMSAAGKMTESVGFDAAHGFTNPSSPRYDEEADKASWACIVDFIRRHPGTI